MNPNSSIRRETFEIIESKFDLHPSTLPSFLTLSGVFSRYITLDSNTNVASKISIVVKAPQKVEIANYLLSMTYNFATGWTTGFLCGDGAVRPRSFDNVYGWQLEQIVALIKASAAWWDHPLLLPAALSRNHSIRLGFRIDTFGDRLTGLEDELGVTIAGGAGLKGPKKNWPACVDLNVQPLSCTLLVFNLYSLRKLVNGLKNTLDFFETFTLRSAPPPHSILTETAHPD